jgi:hypothetical protein
MFHFFTAIKQNSIDTVTYYNFNDTSAIYNNFHVCDFAVVFRMKDGFCWNISFDDEYDFTINEGSEPIFGTRKPEVCNILDASASFKKYLDKKISDIEFSFADDDAICVSECIIFFEDGSILSLVIGEPLDENLNLPVPLEYSSDGVIYVFPEEDFYNEVFSSELPDEEIEEPEIESNGRIFIKKALEIENPLIESPLIEIAKTLVNKNNDLEIPIYNSAGIDLAPFLQNQNNEIDIANNILPDFIERFDLDASESQNSDLINTFLANSEMVASYEYFLPFSSFRIKNSTSEAHLLLTGVTYGATGSKQLINFTEVQFVGIKILDRNYGHIFIRPETFEDKIEELFSRKETDFAGYKKFSRKYYVVHNGDMLANQFETAERIAIIQDLYEVTIEINQNILIAKFPRIINATDCLSMIDFLERI